MSATSDLNQISFDVRQFPEKVVRMGVRELEAAVVDRLRRDTGGDFRLSGLRGGGKLTVTTKVGILYGHRVSGQVQASPRKMIGPWRWLQDGTEPHAMGRGRHPGTRGKQTWSEPVERTIPKVQRQIETSFDSVVQ